MVCAYLSIKIQMKTSLCHVNIMYNIQAVHINLYLNPDIVIIVCLHCIFVMCQLFSLYRLVQSNHLISVQTAIWFLSLLYNILSLSSVVFCDERHLSCTFSLSCICFCIQAGLAGAPARAVSAVKNMNLPEIPRNINIGDISIKVPNLPSFK